MDKSSLPGVIAIGLIFAACWVVIAVAALASLARRWRGRRTGGHRRTAQHAGVARRRLHWARGMHR